MFGDSLEGQYEYRRGGEQSISEGDGMALRQGRRTRSVRLPDDSTDNHQSPSNTTVPHRQGPSQSTHTSHATPETRRMDALESQVHATTTTTKTLLQEALITQAEIGRAWQMLQGMDPHQIENHQRRYLSDDLCSMQNFFDSNLNFPTSVRYSKAVAHWTVHTKYMSVELCVKGHCAVDFHWAIMPLVVLSLTRMFLCELRIIHSNTKEKHSTVSNRSCDIHVTVDRSVCPVHRTLLLSLLDSRRQTQESSSQMRFDPVQTCRLLKDHIRSITNVVHRLTTEIDEAEQRAAAVIARLRSDLTTTSGTLQHAVQALSVSLGSNQQQQAREVTAMRTAMTVFVLEAICC